ncbi:hypothetical protein RND81_06G107800 [Saponaria officinalis]|uniref:Uncharacterized protein n=1 Tax=Saponaria officinalis TaxID=3572 RepID=A0AAW1KAA3_SAPOF
MENNREMVMGWPLGLGSMYMRLRMAERFPIVEPHRRSFLYSPSTSFSSFSSSNLDTESTVSFFQDKSKTLGRLIGIRPRNRRSRTYVRASTDDGPVEPRRRRSERSFSENKEDMRMCDRICIPMCFAAKMNTRKNVAN